MRTLVHRARELIERQDRRTNADDGDWISDSAIDDVEDDRLGHRHLIDPLAELLARGPSIGNVGVFGPWGSGKTSIGRLLRARLEDEQPTKVKFVYFDAWKYQETPLRREFLRTATDQLQAKRAARKFADRLYKKSRSTDIDLSDGNWVSVVWVLLAGLAAATAIYFGISLAAAGIASIGGNDFGDALIEQLTTNAPTVLVSTAILVPLLSLVLNRWQTTWEENEPSSAEQFDKAFRDLIEESLETFDRVVFFIDELDRAPAQAVVGTLETMKTFLGVEGCVFVVAADQLVLEAAVKERSPAVRSPDPKNPYYSTGSAYLDKIFGFRLHIPPVPASRLSPFARDLVVSRPGTWKSIAPHLDDVLSVLVPFHVRSPRRVKVLLNNFVIAYRAIASNPDLQPRLADRDVLVGLAKLVCLKTEFPLFYREVEATPRLLRAVTEALDQRQAASAKYADDPDLWASVVSVLDVGTAADVMLGGAEGDEAERRHASALTDQLHDYLRLSSEVVEFDPEIFYMEARGKAAGLSNQQAHEIRAAAFRGDTAAAEKILAGQSDDVIAAALRYMASLLPEAIGAERHLVLSVLLRASAELPSAPVRKSSIGVADHLEAAHVSGLLRSADFDPYLRLLELGPQSRRERGELAVLRLAKASPSDAGAAFRSVERFSGPGRELLREMAADLARTGSDLLAQALDDVPVDLVGVVIRGAAATVLAEKLKAGDELTENLLTPIGSKLPSSIAWTILGPALANADDEQFERLEPLLEEAPVAPRSVPTVNALLRAISMDGSRRMLYARMLPPARPERTVDRERVAGALTTAVLTAALSDGDEQQSKAVVNAVLRVVNTGQFVISDSHLAPLRKELTAPYGSDQFAARRRQHKILFALAADNPIRPNVWLRLLADSAAALLMTGQPITVEGQQLFSRVVSQVTEPPEDRLALQQLEQALKNERPQAAAGEFGPDRRRFDLSLVQRSLLRNGWSLDSNPDDTANAARAGGSSLDGGTIAVLTDAIRPTFTERPKLVRQAIWRAQIDDWDAEQLHAYFNSLTEQEAFAQMRHCLETRMPAPTRVLGWLRPKLDETKWTKLLTANLAEATRNSDRNHVLAYLAQVVPQKEANRRRIADGVLSVAERGEGSFKIAARWAAEIVRGNTLGNRVLPMADRLLKIRAQKYPHVVLPTKTEAAMKSRSTE